MNYLIIFAASIVHKMVSSTRSQNGIDKTAICVPENEVVWAMVLMLQQLKISNVKTIIKMTNRMTERYIAYQEYT